MESDSLVLDLMFQGGADIDPEAFVTAFGGTEVVTSRKIFDPDQQDPRLEMELSPSMPFRRRDERRLMIIDDVPYTPPPWYQVLTRLPGSPESFMNHPSP